MIHTSTKGQTGLPRYFGQVFEMAQQMQHGRCDFHLPGGRVFRAEGAEPGPLAELHIHTDDLFARLIREGDLGFCEAYLDGDWSTPDLQAFMDLVHAGNEIVYDGFPGQGLLRTFEKFRFWLQRNNREQARKNISYHYDLGNDFYRLWLDDTMTYSSALFEDGFQQSLEAAQTAKYASMVDQMGVSAGDHVLEIGCGWGALSGYFAEQGSSVDAISLSEAQLAWARQQYPDVQFIKQDYRDTTGMFDAIVSVEMVEALGREYWPTFMDCIARNLKPGGRAAIQFIALRDDLFDAYAKSADFIQAYVFPGGMLIRTSEFRRLAEERGLAWQDQEDFGLDYAETLRLWRERFDNAVETDALPAGFDRRFYDLWRFYLMYCEGGFRGGSITVSQVTLVKGRKQGA